MNFDNELYIQNMVSRCCKILVIVEQDKMNLIYTCLELGEVNLLEPITKPKK